MNTLTLAFGTALIVGSSMTATDANAAQFVAADNSAGTQACMAIVSNKPINLAQTMRDLRLNKRVISDKLQCNDMSTAQFASTYGFNKSASYLNLEQQTKTSIQDIAKVSDNTVYVISGSK
ncbi:MULTISPECIES: DUF3718 domain-containing protein [Pseudoalteromonas]|uniref:DUF3718 domain-containing protein n=1 Tax=Pseudoalteromonas TaxID=53246 RepID=UPI00082444A7|nr:MULTISPECIES: DUF3718 domain-containing protein [Pseudoalteromonas]QMW13182.1 DUF3718 domain-containing protein [Pseudoalteromonas sp. MT33b]